MIIPSCGRPALLRKSTSCSITANWAGNERHCARSSLRMTPCRTGTETSACYGNNRAVKRGCCAGRDVPQMSELTPAAPTHQGSTPYKATFYKRVLPTPPCIDFASEEGVDPHFSSLTVAVPKYWATINVEPVITAPKHARTSPGT